MLLRKSQKWLKRQRNVQVDDIVMVMDNTRNTWAMAKVLNAIKDKRGLVRVVQIKTSVDIVTRPIHKLCMLLEAD